MISDQTTSLAKPFVEQSSCPAADCCRACAVAGSACFSMAVGPELQALPWHHEDWVPRRTGAAPEDLGAGLLPQ